jgi:hypothetical protein
MQVKLVRIEQTSPDIGKAEEILNREIKKLESSGKKIKDINLSVVRDAAPEYKTTKSFAFTAMILYD